MWEMRWPDTSHPLLIRARSGVLRNAMPTFNPTKRLQKRIEVGPNAETSEVAARTVMEKTRNSFYLDDRFFLVSVFCQI